MYYSKKIMIGKIYFKDKNFRKKFKNIQNIKIKKKFIFKEKIKKIFSLFFN